MSEQEDDKIFVPDQVVSTFDDEHEEMQMGKDESLRDPWFNNDTEALNWEPKAEGE
jgi:hypothetical protein